jgi:hypothetical protein
MNTLQKVLLAFALTALAIGLVVSGSRIAFAPEWSVALPTGVILLGLFLISRLFHKEMVRFDHEHRSKIESAMREDAALSAEANESCEHSADAHEPVGATSETVPHAE